MAAGLLALVSAVAVALPLLAAGAAWGAVPRSAGVVSGCSITQNYSLASTTASTIEFLNARPDTVAVYWLSFDGRRVYYSTLKPGESVVQPGYLTHAWIVLGPTGECVGYVISDQPAKRFVIQPSAVASPTQPTKKPKPSSPKPGSISAPADVTVEATGRSGAIVAYPPARAPGASSIKYSKRSGSLFPLGTTIVTVTAKYRDTTLRAKFKIRVVDTTPPGIVVPADVSVGATSASGAVASYQLAGATDLVDGSVTPTCSPASGSTFAIGTTTVTCSARDAAGNGATGTFKVTVKPASEPGHYQGTTSQNELFAFDVTSDGTGVANLRTGQVNESCNPGTLSLSQGNLHLTNTWAIAADGSFTISLSFTNLVAETDSSQASYTITGRVSSGTASGTLLVQTSFSLAGTYYTCSDNITWTATRTG